MHGATLDDAVANDETRTEMENRSSFSRRQKTYNMMPSLEEQRRIAEFDRVVCRSKRT